MSDINSAGLTREPLSIAAYMTQNVKVISCDGCNGGNSSEDCSEATHVVMLAEVYIFLLHSASPFILIPAYYPE